MQKMLLIAGSLLLCLPFLFNCDINPVLAYNQKEKFDPRLSYLDNVDKLQAYTDSIAGARHIEQGTYAYVELLESVIEERFYHGFSHLTLRQNWIAALAGKLIKEDYACLVQPDKILQHPNAACSQQALVMMAVLRNKGINYRRLGFPHHYAMGVSLQDEWYFFDANMEPSISKENRRLANWQHHNDYLKKYYDRNRYTDLDYQFGRGQIALVGVTNEIPAKRARLFHVITGVLSKICWLFPLLLVFYRPRIRVQLPMVSFGIKRRKPSFSLTA